MKQKLIILIAIIVVLAVAIFFVNRSGGDGIGGGTASAGDTEISNEGFVMEDSATVEVDIPDNEKKTTEAAADE
jgi:preprotein translocase subunit SecG